jgi:hypothetical protein
MGGEKWNHEQANVFNHPLSAVGEVFSEPPLQVDASKAPSYRGAGANASIISPASSKTSSNSATPPSIIPDSHLSGSGSLQRQQHQQQSQQHQQQSQQHQQSSFNRSTGFFDAGNYNQSV